MRLEVFSAEDAATVAAWPRSAAEAMAWAGADAPWPPAAQDLQTWQDDPDVHPFVLRDGDAAVAYGEVWTDREEHEVELARIVVRPDRRGTGVGRLLVQLLLRRPEAIWSPVAFVRVAPSNVAALACYRSAGFTSVDKYERQAFNSGQPLDYEWLRRDLGEPPDAD